MKPTRYELQVSIGGRWVKIGAWSGHLASRSLPDGEVRDAIEWANDLDAPLGREDITLTELEAASSDVDRAGAGTRAAADDPT